MKKVLMFSIMFVMLVAFAIPTFAATTSIAEKIYSKGSAYGVTAGHKKQMDEYFTNNPITAEQEDFVLSKADECIAIMDKAGVKDVTKLSENDLNSVKLKVQEAATKIGLTVTFSGNSFLISKNGKSIGEYLVKSSSTTATTSANKFVYTGSNSVLGIASVLTAFVAIALVVKLRKNV